MIDLSCRRFSLENPCLIIGSRIISPSSEIAPLALRKERFAASIRGSDANSNAKHLALFFLSLE
jgi:hypothetical protein